MDYYQLKNIKNLLERNYFLYIAVFFTTAIIVGSLISMNNVALPDANISDKSIHSFAYLLLTLSWLLALKSKLNKLKHSILICSLVFVYGIIIEVLQGVLTNYRQADFLDAVANFVGISGAFIFFNLVFYKKKGN
jgi:VanZ family protein